MEEYHSIMKNDGWEIVMTLEGDFVVTSKWIYKVNHATDGSVEKFKAYSSLKVSPKLVCHHLRNSQK